MAKKVDVVICGEVITLKSDEEEAHLQRIARYVDRKLTELTAANANASVNERIRTMLIAINVADDYFKTADALARANDQREKYASELGRMQQEYALLKDKFHELQGELSLTKSELDAFISEFGDGGGTNIITIPGANKRKAR